VNALPDAAEISAGLEIQNAADKETQGSRNQAAQSTFQEAVIQDPTGVISVPKLTEEASAENGVDGSAAHAGEVQRGEHKEATRSSCACCVVM